METLHIKCSEGDIEAVKWHLDEGADVNAMDDTGRTPLDYDEGENADLLRKHGGKTGEELKAEYSKRIGA